jgi:hypothetical protein
VRRARTQPTEVPPLLAVLQQRRLQADTVGQQARPAAPAPPTAARGKWDGLCACRWAQGGPYCEALLRAPGELALRVGQHIMRGGTDDGCPGRRQP